MIRRNDHYVTWAMLMHELEDACEHLADLIAQMTAQGMIEEEDYKVQIANVYGHLNEAWNIRNDPAADSYTEEEFWQRRQFPIDLDPI